MHVTVREVSTVGSGEHYWRGVYSKCIHYNVYNVYDACSSAFEHVHTYVHACLGKGLLAHADDTRTDQRGHVLRDVTTEFTNTNTQKQ